MRRNATLFVLISLLAGFGSTAMSISAGLWLLDLTHSFALAALAGLCTYAPTFLGPWLGALVDRLPRRPLLIGVDVALGLLLLTLLTVHSAHRAWLIYAVLLARGMSYGLLDAGETAILPAALPPAALGNVNGWRSSAQEGTKLLAPLTGAGLYAWQGPVPVVLLAALLPLATAACYALLRLTPPTAPARPTATPVPALTPPAHPPDSSGAPAAATTPAPYAPGSLAALVPEPVAASAAAEPVESPSVPAGAPVPSSHLPESLSVAASGSGPPTSSAPRAAGPVVPVEAGPAGADGGGVWAGLGVLFRLPAVRVPVVIAAVAIGMSGLTDAAVLAHLVHDLHRPAARLGLLSSAQGAGSIVGGLLVGRLLARRGAVRVAALGAFLFGVGRLAWCLPWFPPAVAGSLLVGFGLPWTLIAGVTAIQTETPDHLLGRVAATSNTAMFGPVAVAIPLGSALVRLGALPPMLIAAGFAFAAAIFGLRRRPVAAAKG